MDSAGGNVVAGGEQPASGRRKQRREPVSAGRGSGVSSGAYQLAAAYFQRRRGEEHGVSQRFFRYVSGGQTFVGDGGEPEGGQQAGACGYADAGYAGGFGYAGGTDREGQAVVHGECPKELAGFLRQAAVGREPAESCFVRLQCETVVCLVEGEFAQLPGIRCEGRLSSAAAGRGGEHVGIAVGESGISAGVSYAGGQAGQPYGGVLLVAYEPGTERDAGHGNRRVYTQRHTVGERIDGIRLCVREYLPCAVGSQILTRGVRAGFVRHGCRCAP